MAYPDHFPRWLPPDQPFLHLTRGRRAREGRARNEEQPSLRMDVQLNLGDGLSMMRIRRWGRRTGCYFAFLGVLFGSGFLKRALADPGVTIATQTTLSLSSDNSGPRTKLTLTAHVAATGGTDIPGGVVSFKAAGIDLGSSVVDSEGNATLTTSDLPPGAHQVLAIYQGDATHLSSISPSAQANAAPSTEAGYTVTANPTSLTVVTGSFASVVITLTPVNGFNAYVNLSCSEMPFNATCTFSPSNVLTGCTGTGTQQTCPPATSVLQVQTLALHSASLRTERRDYAKQYGFVFPALFGLGALGIRKRRRFRNTALMLFLFAGMMSLTACNVRWYYLNHGPPPNTGTPPGVYTFTIVASSTNGSLITTPLTSPQLTLTVTN